MNRSGLEFQELLPHIERTMRIKYQASFFADLSALDATPENTLAVLKQLSESGIGLLPSTVNEITLPNMKPVPRLRFVSPSGDSEVFIATGRLDVIKKTPFLGGPELLTLADFANFVELCTSAIFYGRDVTGSRLAFIVQTMSDELPLEELDNYFSKFFTEQVFYKENPPIEWTFRANSQLDLSFDKFNEQINTILKVERVQGKAIETDGIWHEFDRISSEFDINTIPDNTTSRFSQKTFSIFVKAAIPIIEKLEANINSKLE